MRFGMLRVAAVLGPFLCGCAQSTKPPDVGGETHFLHACEDTTGCGLGLDCVCGVCTKPCTTDNICETSSSLATCEPAGTPNGACVNPQASPVCDVECSVNADCNSLGSGFTCEQGSCRKLSPRTLALAQQAYLKASNTGLGDELGYSVAISGDALVVGAYREDSSATGINGDQADNSAADSGAVYVFTRSGDTWSQQAYLKASNTEADDWFGWSVAISGDTLVVGAPREGSNATGINGDQADNSADGSGAAYVFTRSGGTWSQQAYLKASNTGAGDEFGHSVAISGDTLVVGARGEDSIATGVNGDQADTSAGNFGAAYVFTRSGSTWSQQAYLKASNTGASDDFGWSVAISGDTLVVGAHREDSSATGVDGNQADNNALNSGAAYVFTRSGSTWSQQAYLKASNTGEFDGFASSVAISGDTLVVGAFGEGSGATGVNGDQADDSAESSGAAYVFTRSGSTWSQQAYLKASNNSAVSATFTFGSSVAISGDTLVVGAPGEGSSATGINGDQADTSAGNSGAAYVFTRSGSTWSQQAYLKASNTGAIDRFGESVAFSGDTLVVGAHGEGSNATGVNGDQSDNSAEAAGAVYVFR